MIKFQIRMYGGDDILLATVTVPATEATTLAEANAYASRIITPTEGLWYDVVNLEAEAAQEAFYAAEEARGELAGAPDTMECYICGGAMQKVIALGKVVGHLHPTQTYELACGHLAS